MLGRAARALFGATRHGVGGGASGLIRGVPIRTMFIQTRSTPNANATMFLPGRTVLEQGGGLDYPSVRQAGNSPLARQLFGVEGVKAVFFGEDFVTVTKDETSDWAVVRPMVFEVLMDFFTDGSTPVVDDSGTYESDTAINESDSEVVAMIKELLETRVKPAVAADGGMIVYRGFDVESGVVKLEMQGACSTCSSSAITLKNGVENMLRHYVPEVLEVVQVEGKNASAMAIASEKALNSLEKKLEDEGVLRP